MSANSKSRAEAITTLPTQNQVSHHNHSNSTTNLNILMAETIVAQSSRQFHHAKSGSTSAISRNLNKTCKESFTTNGGGTIKAKESGATTIGRPILNQVLNKMLENTNNMPCKQQDVK